MTQFFIDFTDRCGLVSTELWCGTTQYSSWCAFYCLCKVGL